MFHTLSRDLFIHLYFHNLIMKSKTRALLLGTLSTKEQSLFLSTRLNGFDNDFLFSQSDKKEENKVLIFPGKGNDQPVICVIRINMQ